MFLGLRADESDYFMALVELSRAATRPLKESIERKLKHLKHSQEELANRYSSDLNLEESNRMKYYSSWAWSAVHILTSVSQYQNVDAISKKLSIPNSEVKQILRALLEMNLVQKRGDNWICRGGTVFLPRSHPLIQTHHMNWRMRAALDSTKSETDGIHFTAVQSMSRADFEKLKEVIFKMLKTYSQTAEPSRPEELVNFNLDFFRMG